VVFLIGALWLSVVHFRALELTAHVPLIMAAVVASLVARAQGWTFREIQKGMTAGISLSLEAVLILLGLDHRRSGRSPRNI